MLDNKDLDSVESNRKREREKERMEAMKRGQGTLYLRRAPSSGWNERASDLVKFENGLTNPRYD